MDYIAIQHVMEYVEDEKVPAQITHTDGVWTVDFKSQVHARVCYAELDDAGQISSLNINLLRARIS